jgi:hypothetical protein
LISQRPNLFDDSATALVCVTPKRMAGKYRLNLANPLYSFPQGRLCKRTNVPVPVPVRAVFYPLLLGKTSRLTTRRKCGRRTAYLAPKGILLATWANNTDPPLQSVSVSLVRYACFCVVLPGRPTITRSNRFLPCHSLEWLPDATGITR